MHLYSSKIIDLYFSCLVDIFVWFGYQGDGDFIEYLWGCSFLFNLLEEFGKNWYKFFFVCLVEFSCSAIGSKTSACKVCVCMCVCVCVRARACDRFYFHF